VVSPDKGLVQPTILARLFELNYSNGSEHSNKWISNSTCVLQHGEDSHNLAVPELKAHFDNFKNSWKKFVRSQTKLDGDMRWEVLPSSAATAKAMFPAEWERRFGMFEFVPSKVSPSDIMRIDSKLNCRGGVAAFPQINAGRQTLTLTNGVDADAYANMSPMMMQQQAKFMSSMQQQQQQQLMLAICGETSAGAGYLGRSGSNDSIASLDRSPSPSVKPHRDISAHLEQPRTSRSKLQICDGKIVLGDADFDGPFDALRARDGQKGQREVADRAADALRGAEGEAGGAMKRPAAAALKRGA
jgi:hypothetical protein